jgi:esterase
MSIVDPKDIYHRIHGPSILPPYTYPVVLLHGLMGFSANWGKIWPELHNRRPVLVLDQRGHGKSPKPKTGYSPTDYARDLLGLLDLLGWKKAHIVGHSMGGRVALRFCSLFPERSVSLTMEDSGTDARPERVSWIQDLLANIPTPFSTREEAKKFFAENFRDDPMTGGFLHMNLEPKENGLLDWRFHAPAMIETVETGRATDASREFANLQLPTLIVRGGNSKELPAPEARHMAESRKLTSLVTVEGTGHFVHAEKATEFNKALAVFLEQVEHETFK